MGLRTPLDGDEAVEGIAALRILHGHLALVEPDGRYLGALESYVLAPFVLALGPTLLAIRACFALAGGAYVLLVAAMGRRVWGSAWGGVLAGTLAAVFPLFALTYGVKARTYGLMLPIETALLLALAALAWPRGRLPRWAWLGTGILAGLAAWHHPLLLMVVVAGLLAVLVRRAAGPAQIVAAGAGFLVGDAPWLIYNAQHRLGSLRHLGGPAHAYTMPVLGAVGKFLSTVLPIFVGARVNYCGPETAPWWLVDATLLTVVITAAFQRRTAVRALFRGDHGQLQPIDLVLGVGLLAILAVTVGFFNALFCEPRYTMPLAVPLVFATGSALRTWWRVGAGKPAAVALVLAYCLATVPTLARTLAPGPDVVTTASAQGRPDLPAAARALDAEHPGAVWAAQSLARPLQYYDGDHLVVGEYGGYVGFPDTQRSALAAAHPAWLFLDGDADAARLEAECAHRGLTYRRSSPAAGLVLYDELSGRVLPADLGITTQAVESVE